MFPEHKEFMDSPITSLEIREMIKSVKLNKAPGPDSYPIEFYKCFFLYFRI